MVMLTQPSLHPRGRPWSCQPNPHPALEGDHGHDPSHNPTLDGDHTVVPSTPQVYFPSSGVSFTYDQLQFGNIK